MPKMVIKKANKYYTKFKITPSKKLQKDLKDWPKRIVIKVTDFKEGKDYEVHYKVDRNPKIVDVFYSKQRHLDGLQKLQRLQKKNITIIVKNVKDVYDTSGNLIHDTRATFFIKGYINYPKSTEKLVKAAGVSCKSGFTY